MKKENVIAVATGTAALCATAVLAATRNQKSPKPEQEPARMLPYTRCPVCGTIAEKNARTCQICGCSFHPCPSCGRMMKDSVCFCRYCGLENEATRYHTVQGITYKPHKTEPAPKMEVNHDYCCCGTPFAFDAKYCQFCGKVRPKPGESYLRKDMPS